MDNARPAPRRHSVVASSLLAGVVATASVLNTTTSDQVSRGVVGTMRAWPGWAQSVVALAADGGLLALAGLLAVAGWRARTRGPRPVAAALLGGLGTLLAYVISEWAKDELAQGRPCRTLPGVEALLSCPGAGDWSLPSNHATLAAALAAAVVVVQPRLWAWAVPIAALVATSRVAAGVHFPHDVTTGLLLGAGVVLAVTIGLSVPAGRLVRGAARHPVVGRLLLRTEEPALRVVRKAEAKSVPQPDQQRGARS